MRLGRIWVLRGPNIWARVPVIEVDVEELTSGWPVNFGSQLANLLSPFVADQNRPAFKAIRTATTSAQALPWIALELQHQAGCPVVFVNSRPGPGANVTRIVFEFEEETIGREALKIAVALCQAAVESLPFDLAVSLKQLRQLAYDVRLGPSTASIVRAAQQRSIPTVRLNQGSLVQLGQGVRGRRIWTAETDRTGVIAEAIAKDKVLACSLLRSAGIPVPEGRTVSDANDAWAGAQEIGLPVVVKPQDGNHGRGVATNLQSEDAVRKAYTAAYAESAAVLIEKYIPGTDHRLLIIGNQLIAAALREPAQVLGDGRSTIQELIADANRDPRRSDGHSTALSYIKLDAVALGVLLEQGYTPESIPPKDSKVLVRRNGNLSTGGTAIDVTDQVHPSVAARAVAAARLIGLDIAGVDIVTLDISRPLEEVGGAIVEVNAGPGLRMHQEPSGGQPRPVGEAIVNLLFPEGTNGRIPIVAVSGVNGKTTTTRLVANILREAGFNVGMTCTDGAYIQHRRIDAHDCSGPRSARSILLHPHVDAAVLETARGGILREGLGFDFCDVAIVTNIGKGDHLGLRGVDTLEELARVKRTVAEAVFPDGHVILNAGDPLVAAMAPYCPSPVIFFSLNPDNSHLIAHCQANGKAIFVKEGQVILATGQETQVLLGLDEIDFTQGGLIPFQVENALAAAAATWALGTPLITIQNGLRSFRGDSSQSPGRFNVFRFDAATVIVDYAHNPSALAALVASLDAFPHQRRIAVFTPFDRRDEDVFLMGQILGNAFDQILLVEDVGNRERTDGDLIRLIRQGLNQTSRLKSIDPIAGEIIAIKSALNSLHSGDLLVIGIEAIEDGLKVVEDWIQKKRESSS